MEERSARVKLGEFETFVNREDEGNSSPLRCSPSHLASCCLLFPVMNSLSVATETNIFSSSSSSSTAPDSSEHNAQPHLQLPSLAQILPPHILSDIFLEVIRLQEHEGMDSTERIDEAMHGSRLLEWDSHESIRHLALVCRSWEDTANFVLYRSVALLSATSTQLFLRTAVLSPSVVKRTSYLVLGLGKHREEAAEEVEGHLGEPIELVKVLGRCSNLRHLQLRPIHQGARSSVLAALSSLELTSFAYVVRFQGSGWFKEVIQPTDLAVLLSPTLRKLELDFNTDNPIAESTIPQPPFTLPLTSISSLRLQIEFPIAHVLAVVSSCAHTLQHLELYLETPIEPHQVVTAITPCGSTLRSLSIITNPASELLSSSSPPSLPLVDVLLPHLPKVEVVHTAAHDISLAAFTFLPPSLRRICIHTFGVEVLDSPQTLLEAVQRIPRGSSLKILCIHDTLDVWDSRDVKEMILMCRQRGLSFTLVDAFDCGTGI